MKKQYCEPEIEIIRFSMKEAIAAGDSDTSGNGDYIPIDGDLFD